MSEKTLRIFELCKQLAELLGDKEAIADIKRLYNKHPDMFKNVEEVAKMIKEVAKEPEIITNAKADNAVLAAKRLNEPNKMGDIVIQNDKGTNVVIHANKKREKEFDRLKDSLVETPALSTHRDLPTGELITQSKDKLSGANALSANTSPELPIIAKPELSAKALNGEANYKIIQQPNTQSQTTKSNHAHKAQNKHKSKSNHNERGL